MLGDGPVEGSQSIGTPHPSRAGPLLVPVSWAGRLQGRPRPGFRGSGRCLPTGSSTSDGWGHTKPFGSLNLRNQVTACTVSSLRVKPAVCRCQGQGLGGGRRGGRRAAAAVGAGVCRWFSARMGFRFRSMTARIRVTRDPRAPEQVAHGRGGGGRLWSRKEGEAVQFTFKKSAKGLDSLHVTCW